MAITATWSIKNGFKADAQKCAEEIRTLGDEIRAEQVLEESFHNQQPLLNRIFGNNVPEFTAKLRWNRLFEAAVFVNGNGPVR